MVIARELKRCVDQVQATSSGRATQGGKGVEGAAGAAAIAVGTSGAGAAVAVGAGGGGGTGAGPQAQRPSTARHDTAAERMQKRYHGAAKPCGFVRSPPGARGFAIPSTEGGVRLRSGRHE